MVPNFFAKRGRRVACEKLAIITITSLYMLDPPGGSEWIISVGDYVNNSFTALGSSDPREVRLEL